MMRLFQTIVFCSVLFANVYWQLTPNGYLAALVAAGIAYLATLAVVGLKERGLTRRGEQAWEERSGD